MGVRVEGLEKFWESSTIRDLTECQKTWSLLFYLYYPLFHLIVVILFSNCLPSFHDEGGKEDCHVGENFRGRLIHSTNFE